MIDHPELLWLLFILLPVSLILWRRYITGKRDLRAVGGDWLKLEFENVYIVKWFFQAFFYLLFVFFIVVSLSGPKWGSRPIPDEREGQEILFLFDISNSMLAEDITPSRLKRSAALARTIVDAAPAARYGIAGFKGHASLILPITEDLAAVHNVLESISPDMISSPGTDIESGIRVGLDSFTSIFESHKYLVLFTDGEYQTGNPAIVAPLVLDSAIDVHIVAVGTAEPSPIPLRSGEYMKDDAGNTLTTTLRADTLEAFAEASEGRLYLAANSGARSELISAISGIDFDIRWRFAYQTFDRYHVFLLVGLFCLFVSAGVRFIKWRNTF